MFNRLIKTKFVFSVLILVSILWVFIFGVLILLQMPHGSHNLNCTFNVGEYVVCQLNPLEHIFLLQKTFVFNPIFQLLAILLVGLSLFVVFIIKDPPKILFKNYSRFKIIIDYYSYLFSKGILNPKSP